MKDFGTLNSEFSTCSVCGSGNHKSLDHHSLNDAAPELYEALKAIVDMCDDPNPPPPPYGASLAVELCKLLPAARAAIAKAENK